MLKKKKKLKKTTKKKVVKKTTKKRKPQTRALVIKQVQLTKPQAQLIQQPTPREFIKERKARGGKMAKYVEGGYVIAQLNTIFGAPNWDFEILEQSIERELKTVWVRGKLTIIDHKNNYRVGKTQYGQHDFAKGVPLGDTLKAATTDCLKKCASMFGIALDVYWNQLDEDKGSKPIKIDSKAQAYQLAVTMIEHCKNTAMLEQIKEKIEANDKKYFTKEEVEKLLNLCGRKLDELLSV